MVSRQLRVNNRAPFDIRLDWRLFLQDPEAMNKSRPQLLDLVTSFGAHFPLLDEHGEEVLVEPPGMLLIQSSQINIYTKGDRSILLFTQRPTK